MSATRIGWKVATAALCAGAFMAIASPASAQYVGPWGYVPYEVPVPYAVGGYGYGDYGPYAPGGWAVYGHMGQRYPYRFHWRRRQREPSDYR